MTLQHDIPIRERVADFLSGVEFASVFEIAGNCSPTISCLGPDLVIDRNDPGHRTRRCMPPTLRIVGGIESTAYLWQQVGMIAGPTEEVAGTPARHCLHLGHDVRECLERRRQENHVADAGEEAMILHDRICFHEGRIICPQIWQQVQCGLFLRVMPMASHSALFAWVLPSILLVTSPDWRLVFCRRIDQFAL